MGRVSQFVGSRKGYRMRFFSCSSNKWINTITCPGVIWKMYHSHSMHPQPSMFAVHQCYRHSIHPYLTSRHDFSYFSLLSADLAKGVPKRVPLSYSPIEPCLLLQCLKGDSKLIHFVVFSFLAPLLFTRVVKELSEPSDSRWGWTILLHRQTRIPVRLVVRHFAEGRADLICL